MQEVKWGVEWIGLAEDNTRTQAVVNTVMNISCSIKCGQFLDHGTVSISMILLHGYN